MSFHESVRYPHGLVDTKKHEKKCSAPSETRSFFNWFAGRIIGLAHGVQLLTNLLQFALLVSLEGLRFLGAAFDKLRKLPFAFRLEFGFFVLPFVVGILQQGS